MKVASWDIQSDQIRLHTNRNLVNRLWRLVLWAQGEDGEQVKKTIQHRQRCNLTDIAGIAAEELLEMIREKEPVTQAGWRVELRR
ncbi:hypothetical protein [Microbulbifer sp. PSTR4-B]|uniref:hypothetical protein n=1 Tax=unclassified Microbulbifer TaxID=2619833 RepID=UPI00403AEE95